jgi:omega-hydroxy-beta-dihydromenaquinone-9 sulfotransferase
MTESRARRFHPLCGADPRMLAGLVLRHGLNARSALPLGIAMAVSLLKAPVTLAEHLMVSLRRGEEGLGEAPVFIVGHWRSGTTHLYNIMSKAPQWGFVSPFATALPWDFLLIGRLFAPLLARVLPEHRFIDNIPVEPDSPQEDEIGLANMTPLSIYHALYFPRHFNETFDAGLFFDGVAPDAIARWSSLLRYYYDKLSIEAKGARLLIKNPVYTARIALLRRIWPGAKFIHIHRNPYQVFISMRNFYERLFAEFALERADHLDLDEVILKTYRRMMGRFTEDAAAIPPGHLVELSYDALQAEPEAALARIYGTLGLSGFDTDRAAFLRYLASVEGYRKNSYIYPSETRARVGEALRPFIERWSYEPPA